MLMNIPLIFNYMKDQTQTLLQKHLQTASHSIIQFHQLQRRIALQHKRIQADHWDLHRAWRTQQLFSWDMHPPWPLLLTYLHLQLWKPACLWVLLYLVVPGDTTLGRWFLTLSSLWLENGKSHSLFLIVLILPSIDFENAPNYPKASTGSFSSHQ